MNKMIEAIELIHQNAVCLFKIGNFYHAYGKDSYILGYLFGYRVKEGNTGYKECGFPISALNKVIASLEKSKINYLQIDSRNNYYVDLEMDFDNLNCYNSCYEKAKKIINYKKRVSIVQNMRFEISNLIFFFAPKTYPTKTLCQYTPVEHYIYSIEYLK